MEGFKVIAFLLVAFFWLGIWIIRMFRKAFDQPTSRKPEPYIPQPDVTISEVLRQELKKKQQKAQEVLDKIDVPILQENERPKYRSLENLKPQIHSLERLDTDTGQREDIVRIRREPNFYQTSHKNPKSIYAKMLQTPEDAKKAIVLAEILKRKY